MQFGAKCQSELAAMQQDLGRGKKVGTVTELTENLRFTMFLASVDTNKAFQDKVIIDHLQTLRWTWMCQIRSVKRSKDVWRGHIIYHRARSFPPCRAPEQTAAASEEADCSDPCASNMHEKKGVQMWFMEVLNENNSL